jgi:hypothetical protein
MTIQEIRTAIEAEQMIQQRNPPTSAKWKEASQNLRHLGAMLNRELDKAKKESN